MPDVNKSNVACTGDDDWVRVGLMKIKGVREETKKTIVTERTCRGPYTCFPDLLQRVPVEDDEMAMLIMAGIFDHLDPDLSRGAMHYLYAYWRGLGKPQDFDEWYPLQRERARRSCRQYTESEKIRHELEAFGTLVSKHPLEQYAKTIAKIPRILAKDIRQFAGKSVTLAGWPIASKEVSTKHGEAMEFWSFEDETDIFHTVLFPRAYDKYCRLLVGARPLMVSGVAQKEYNAITVNIKDITSLVHES
jgi:DNA polymerase III alpha subunit